MLFSKISESLKKYLKGIFESKGSPPLYYYDLMFFLKIDFDKKGSWFSLEKFNQRHEFSSGSKHDKGIVQKFVGILKLYCISTDFLNNYKILDVIGKGHFSQVPFFFLQFFIAFFFPIFLIEIVILLKLNYVKTIF